MSSENWRNKFAKILADLGGEIEDPRPLTPEDAGQGRVWIYWQPRRKKNGEGIGRAYRYWGGVEAVDVEGNVTVRFPRQDYTKYSGYDINPKWSRPETSRLGVTDFLCEDDAADLHRVEHHLGVLLLLLRDVRVLVREVRVPQQRAALFLRTIL
eukprot:COSAG05_NODE_124_length_17559_cov_8.898643_14_plen_154_part_00